ncbi:MAG: class I SAM-dependent methyltransferase [bacterium]|nr:class I SAM-dependent methyltransferase [bacterium]
MPSHDDITIYTEYLLKAIAGVSNPRALVLGATPELRDSALHHGCSTWSIDRNEHALTAMTGVMKEKESVREQRIVSDWLAYDYAGLQFDVILADASLNNVAKEDTPNLLEKMTKHLAPSGFFVTRHLVHLPLRPVRTAEEIIAEHRTGAMNQYDMYYELRFYSDLATNAYDATTNLSYWGKFFDALDAAYAQGKLKREEYDSIAWQRSDVIHTMFAKEEWEKLLLQNFSIADIRYQSAQQFSAYFPFYILQKKK